MDFTAKENYKNSSKLKTRKEFHLNYSNPKINLDEEVYHLLNLKGNESILDIGCGYGSLLSVLKNRGHKGKLFGVDLSKGMIDECIKNSKGQNINFEIGDIEELKFKDDSFDIVITKHMLYHVENVEKAVKEIRRVLKNKGQWLITLHNLKDINQSKIENLKKILNKAIGNETFLGYKNRINMENIKTFTKDFIFIKELKINSYINLKDKEPVIKYLDTFKEFIYPIPENNIWDKGLKVISKKIDLIIKKEGSFNDKVSSGIILLQKSK